MKYGFNLATRTDEGGISSDWRTLLDTGGEPDEGGAADFDDLSGILPILGQSGAGAAGVSAAGSATAGGPEFLTATGGADRLPALVSVVFAEKESVDSLVVAWRKPGVAKARRATAVATASDWDLDGDVDFDDIARFRTLLK